MFFPNKIKNIQPGDKVLEIGPGAHPFHRSDVLLELKFESAEEEQFQFGNTGKLTTNKEVVYYDGNNFPFEDGSFNYIICSHVLEHVIDIPLFLKEVFRVGKKGYFEFPMLYYDFAYNIAAHVNFLRFDSHKNTLFSLKKEKTAFHDFDKVFQLFNHSLEKGYRITQPVTDFIMQGFEWDKPFELHQNATIDQLIHQDIQLPNFNSTEYYSRMLSIKDLSKIFLKKITNKF